MSEQSNKPSPDTARAAVPQPESNPARERANAELRAPLTQTGEVLQTKPERRHPGEERTPGRTAGEARGGQPRPVRAEGEGRAPRPQGERTQRAPRPQTGPRARAKHGRRRTAPAR
ncbi:hypothetical protein [Massilia sp. Se16.2.3]|uniref:hypothetical protein n=1 Tax=Massilia sp. Se16.2.3 TaxID=2709303 RepID=UPI001600D36F|nr:hypothetical protein [Massilia sp. Se16.2.3]QNB00910.1 hypothetical protein G4G31_22325 [Massilia sp. Se16.2.3]